MAELADLQAKLKLLSDDYVAKLPAKLEQLVQMRDGLVQSGWDVEGFENFHRSVHSLSGSGKTFGFADVSVAARNLENYLKPLLQAKVQPDQEQREQIDRLLNELKGLNSVREKADDTVMVDVSPVGVAVSVPRRIYVVDDDRELAAELKVQLSYFGYQVSVFHTLDSFRLVMQQGFDGIVLMDINFPEDSLGGVHLISELQQGRTAPIPVIFLSSHDAIEIRLEAVRAGCVAYLKKPVNLGVLIDKLDELTSTQNAAAYRVLIVDDEPELANFYAGSLEQAGLSVRVVNDPLQIMKPLLEFSPDLVLIDMYMPSCSGMELAKVLRQIDTLIGIPIVFLSSETNMDKQLAAIGLGGDDFLTKPIEPQHLVSAVISRVKRSLILRSFMVRDSLTGLLNHTAIKNQLDHEMARARRQSKPLTFAMVDIDHFKNVNDSYGHPVGDRVIKSLSRLLKQRLRENDVVGRYGGEEFAVILVDADGETAVRVMDDIRKDFAKLLHLAEDKEFSVSFSCGIADIAHFSEASKLTDAADRALYQAKHSGRNQVRLADAKSD